MTFEIEIGENNQILSERLLISFLSTTISALRKWSHTQRQPGHVVQMRGKKKHQDRHTTLHYALHSNFRFLRMLVCFLSCDVTRNKPKKYLRWKDLPKKTMFKGLNKDFIWVLNLWKTLPLSDDQWKHPNVFILEVETGVGQYQWTVRASPECHCGLTNLIRTLIMVNMEGKKQVQI